jgi:hypothetical protein
MLTCQQKPKKGVEMEKLQKGCRWARLGYLILSTLALLVAGIVLGLTIKTFGVSKLLTMLLTAAALRTGQLSFSNGAILIVLLLWLIHGVFSFRMNKKTLFIADAAVVWGLLAIQLGVLQLRLMVMVYVPFWVLLRFFAFFASMEHGVGGEWTWFTNSFWKKTEKQSSKSGENA